MVSGGKLENSRVVLDAQGSADAPLDNKPLDSCAMDTFPPSRRRRAILRECANLGSEQTGGHCLAHAVRRGSRGRVGNLVRMPPRGCGGVQSVRGGNRILSLLLCSHCFSTRASRAARPTSLRHARAADKVQSVLAPCSPASRFASEGNGHNLERRACASDGEAFAASLNSSFGLSATLAYRPQSAKHRTAQHSCSTAADP